MRYEVLRQLVHFSGIFLILLSYFINKLYLSMLFLFISVFFFLYSMYIRKVKGHGFLYKIEHTLRNIALKLERKNAKKPFIGAFFFYFSLFLVFLLFPSRIAAASGAMLAVGDSLSTLVGKRFGKHKIFKKSVEGSVACFFGSFIGGMLFLPYHLVIIGSVVATLVELCIKIDDNLTIPLSSAFVMYLASFTLNLL